MDLNQIEDIENSMEDIENSMSDKLAEIIAVAQSCINEGAASINDMKIIKTHAKQLAILIGDAMGKLRAYQVIAGR